MSVYRQKRKGELGPLKAGYVQSARLRFECYELPHFGKADDTCDPVVGVYMKNGQGKYKLCGQTERQENNPDPIFNDSVEVVSEAPYATGKIKLVVFDTDSPDHALKGEDIISGCEVDLAKLRKKPKGIWLKMKRGGHIMVSAKWRDTKEEDDSGASELKPRSELSAEYENHGTMYFEARDLPSAKDGSCDPIIGVYQKLDGEDWEELGQTEHLLNTRSPTFKDPVNALSPLGNDHCELRIVMFDVAEDKQLKGDDKIGGVDLHMNELRKSPSGLWLPLDHGGAVRVVTRFKDWKRPRREADMDRINELSQPKAEECKNHDANWAQTNGSFQPLLKKERGAFDAEAQSKARADPRDIYRKEAKEYDYEKLRSSSGLTPRTKELAKPKPRPEQVGERKASKKVSSKQKELFGRLSQPKYQTTREEVKVEEGQMRPGKQFKWVTKKTNK